MGEWMLGITILMSFCMPKSDSDWVAEFNRVTDGSIHVVIIVGGIIRSGRSCIKHRVDVQNDALIVAETLESCTVKVGSAVV